MKTEVLGAVEATVSSIMYPDPKTGVVFPVRTIRALCSEARKLQKVREVWEQIYKDGTIPSSTPAVSEMDILLEEKPCS